MRKVVIHSPGSYDRLLLEDHPDPAPGPGQVAIDVTAAGVNFADGIVRMGLYASAKEFVGWPITPGFEVSGKVAAVGAGVADLAPGADVMAVTLFGGYASRIVAPRSQVFAPPRGFDLPSAAGFPAVYLTAYYALAELGRPRPGASVLIHSAAGGVGGALLQIAKIMGCRTVGVVGSSHKVEAAKKLGADVVIDKSSEDLWAAAKKAAPGGYEVVLDANGVETLAQSYAHTAPTGRLVIYGFHTMFPRGGRGKPNWLKLAWTWLRTPRFNPLQLTNDNKSVMAFNLSYLFKRQEILSEAMHQMAAWAAEGRLTAPPVKRYPVERVADAQRDLESGATVGKLVLTF
jgi:NADPH:quinone reductase-like Zn-dependent oxidoreductase